MVNSRTEQNNNNNKKFPICAQQKTGNDKRNYPTTRNKNKIKRLKKKQSFCDLCPQY